MHTRYTKSGIQDPFGPKAKNVLSDINGITNRRETSCDEAQCETTCVL